MRPLNGSKTHPLSNHAKSVLSSIANRPMVRHEVNPGVANRLLREALVESVMLPSPYKSDKGGDREHLQITDSGLAKLNEVDCG